MNHNFHIVTITLNDPHRVIGTNNASNIAHKDQRHWVRETSAKEPTNSQRCSTT